MKENLYERNGYKDRADYLTQLAEENEVDAKLVHELATLLGEDEDFDGLVSSVQDYAWMESERVDWGWSGL